jgi:CRP/FNR family cyclic AMP-dependent transcriptional regulator
MAGLRQVGRSMESTAEQDGRLRLLAALPLFRDLPESVVDDIGRMARREKWAAGTIIFHRGDPSDALICIDRGHIKISLMNADGRELTLQHLRGGTILGEVGVLDGSSRTADATAVSATTALVLEVQRFNELMDKHPALARAAIRYLCGLVRYTTDHIESIALHNLETRLARFLLRTMRQARLLGSEEFELDLSQSDIADLIGSSRPKVNQALAAFEKNGTIEREGKLLRCNAERLRRAAGLDN